MKKSSLKQLVLMRREQLLMNPEKGDRFVYRYGRCEVLNVPKGKAWDITRLEWEDEELYASARRTEVKLMEW